MKKNLRILLRKKILFNSFGQIMFFKKFVTDRYKKYSELSQKMSL